MKLVRMKIAGYRSLVDVEFAVRPLTMLIGPNGSGKTSVLDVLSLLQAGMQNALTRELAQRGGLAALLPRAKPKLSQLQIRLDFENAEGWKYAYQIGLGATPTSHKIVSETLERFTPDGHRNLVTALARPQEGLDTYGVSDPLTVTAMPPHLEELALAETAGTRSERDIRAILFRMARYEPLDVTQRSSVRIPQTLTPSHAPLPAGESFFSALYNLREHHEESYKRVLDVLRLTFPGFSRLEFPIVGAGQVNLAWHQDNLAGPLYSNELSDGTLRFLWLATILLTPEPPPLVLIDEPESSLHPQMLRVLAELMQDASLRTTVIVATHATELIRWLKPDQVLVLDKEDGRTRATWADEMDLDAWLREYTLSDLWLMGNLGGRS
jgi:predicted ATPase